MGPLAQTPNVDHIIQTYLDNAGDDQGAAHIDRAFAIAAAAHAPQRRATGEPYIIHPVAVAATVAELGMDADTIAAALCHDVVEDTDVTHDDLATHLGETVALLVDGVTKLRHVSHLSRETAAGANLRKLLLAATDDPRVLVLKIADRLHNASTLAPLAPAKRKRVAEETLHVYAPLAHRLGMNQTAGALEDAAFEALQPDLFAKISARIDELAPDRHARLDTVVATTIDALHAAGVDATVTGRPKHVYSTWRKTVHRGQKLDSIADLIGIRVLVPTATACYGALGLVHQTFTPVPERIRDYIAQPRFGHYQSLHTTVLVDKTTVEVQIRTWKMHALAEHGIAAHWRYKEDSIDVGAVPAVATPRAPDLPWLRNLLDSGMVDEVSPEEFLAAARHDLGTDEVVAFTPAGDPVVLPAGATVLDAAYAVHTEVGDRCSRVLVNGIGVPRNTVLRPGDMFEVETHPKVEPDTTWLDDVVTNRARHAIHAATNHAARAHNLTAAAADLNAAVLALGATPDWVTTTSVDDVAPMLGYATAASLLAAFAAHPELVELTAAKVHAHWQRQTADRVDLAAAQTDPAVQIVPAQCCTVAPGSEGVGVRAPSSSLVAIHATDCLKLVRAPGTFYDVTHAPGLAGTQTVLEVHALPRRGLLRDVAAAVETVGASLLGCIAGVGRDNVSRIQLTATTQDRDTNWRLSAALNDVDGVFCVSPVASTTQQTA